VDPGVEGFDGFTGDVFGQLQTLEAQEGMGHPEKSCNNFEGLTGILSST